MNVQPIIFFCRLKPGKTLKYHREFQRSIVNEIMSVFRVPALKSSLSLSSSLRYSTLTPTKIKTHVDHLDLPFAYRGIASYKRGIEDEDSETNYDDAEEKESEEVKEEEMKTQEVKGKSNGDDGSLWSRLVKRIKKFKWPKISWRAVWITLGVLTGIGTVLFLIYCLVLMAAAMLISMLLLHYIILFFPWFLIFSFLGGKLP